MGYQDKLKPVATSTYQSKLKPINAQPNEQPPVDPNADNSFVHPVRAIGTAFKAGIEKVKQGAQQYQQAESSVFSPKKTPGALKMAAGVIEAAASPLAPLFAPIGGAINQAADKISNIPAVQRFAQTRAGEVAEKVADFTLDAATVAGVGTGPKALPRTIRTPAPKAAPKPPKIIVQRKAELQKVVDSNPILRRTVQKHSAQGIDAVDLLSQTDLLKGAVDSNGSIKTLPAIEELTAFIDPYEKVISANLKREGVRLPLTQVEQVLRAEVDNAGLEGAALDLAHRKIDAEIAGLSRRADAEGYVMLDKVHDAKVTRYATINYMDPGAKLADKAIARALKQTVEKNTKSVDAQNLNRELSRHYSVLNLLEKLNGKKVEGGRLGKYFASTIGTIVGSHFGPLGAVAGAELGARIKGAQMAFNKLGKAGGKPLSVSDDMLRAEQQSKQPRLALPPGNPARSSWVGSGPAIQMGDGFKADAQAQFIGQSSKSVGNRQNIQPATINSTKAPSIPKTLPKPKKKASEVAPLPGTFKPSLNIAPGDTKTSPAMKAAWPTTASKPSKVSDTSTGNAPTGKEGVSAQRADTSGPFEGVMYRGQSNKPNSNSRALEFGEGTYLTAEKSYAAKFGDVAEHKLPPNTKLIDAETPVNPTVARAVINALDGTHKKNVEQLLSENPQATFREVWRRATELGYDQNALSAALKENGFDGINFLGGENLGQKKYPSVVLFKGASPSIPKEGTTVPGSQLKSPALTRDDQALNYKLTQRDLTTIKTDPRNPTTETTVKEILADISAGKPINEPIIVNSDGLILDGHNRFEALRRSGATKAPTYEPIRGIIKANEQNTNLADSSGRGGIIGRAADALKKAKDAYKKSPFGDQRGFIKNPLKNQYPGEKDLTSAVLDQLEGKTTVSRTFIEDLTNQPSLRQAERDLVRQLLKDEGDTVKAIDFANRVKTELLPLERSGGFDFATRHESTTLPDEIRGPVANYTEHIYQSPIKTSAGEVHFSHYPQAEPPANYFAHSRIEDLPTSAKDPELNAKHFLKDAVVPKEPTRRVIEIQSDLFQKGRLENEVGYLPDDGKWTKKYGNMPVHDARALEVSKLEPYRNTWHERIISEEVRQAAKDKKTKLQFPTGETAMKIEGLGEANTRWFYSDRTPVSPARMKVGDEIGISSDFPADESWIITDVLGDGKFKAVQKSDYEISVDEYGSPEAALAELKKDTVPGVLSEGFDISGKVDTSNPIFRFYEKEVGKYLTNRFGAKRIKDERGVEWWEVNITKDMAQRPVNAFTGLGQFPFMRNKK